MTAEPGASPDHEQVPSATAVHNTWLVAATCSVGTVVAGAITFVNGAILKLSYPHNSFLLQPGERFMDFNNSIRYARMDDPYSIQVMVYFPGTNMVLWPIKQLETLAGMLLMFGLLLGVTVALAFVATRGIRPHAPRLLVMTAFLISYPILFAIDRANFEILIYAFVAAFVAASVRNKRAWAVVALSCAIAMKLTPALFAGVFLRKGDRRYLVLGGALAVVQMAIGLVILRPPVAESFKMFRENLSFYDKAYVAGDHGYAFGHSLFGGLKGFVTLVADDAARLSFGETFAPAALIVAVVALGAATLLIGIVDRPLWWKMTVATTALLLFTPVSADYRLILLFVPLSMFLAERGPIPRGSLLAVCFGLLLVPKTVDWSFGVLPAGLGVAVSSFTSALLLLVILVVTLRLPFPGEGRETEFSSRAALGRGA